MRRRIAKTILICTFFAMLVLSLFLILKNDSEIDSNLSRKSEYKLELNGKEQFLVLLGYKKDNSYQYDVSYKKSFFESKKIRIDGFEDNISLCNQSVVHLEEGDAICLTDNVGVHGQNLVLLLAKNSELYPVQFTDQQKNSQNNLISDQPNIIIKDFKNGNLLEIAAENRDYDKDPLVNVIRTYYRQDGGRFVFDSAVNIQYDR